jgi:CheY-like chemotaxis protein
MAVVLLVDDDADSSEAVLRFLRKSGHRVIYQPNGREALSALTSESPDVVVLDARMPEMDGTSFLEVIRCYLRWQTLPVIMLTAYAEGHHIRRAVELGVKRIFLKAECDLAELLAEIGACTAGANPQALGGQAHQGPRFN